MASSINPFDLSQLSSGSGATGYWDALNPLFKSAGYTGNLVNTVEDWSTAGETGNPGYMEVLDPKAVQYLKDQNIGVNRIYDSGTKGYYLQGIGADGSELGRWNYGQSNDTLRNFLKGAGTVWGLGYGLGSLGSTMLGGAAGAGTGAGSSLGIDALGNLAGSSLMDSAAASALSGAGTLAPGGVASLIPSGAQLGGGLGALGGALGSSGSSLGVNASGDLLGKSLMDNAAAGAYGGAGTLAPGGVGSLIPTGAEIGAMGGGGLLTGGMFGGAGGAAGGLSSLFGNSAVKDAVKGAIGGGSGGGAPGTGAGSAGQFNLGNLLGGLAQMYQSNQYMNSIDKLANTLGDTSAYEKALRQELERRDSASGRRSQYGPREVELQAKMYDTRSKNATSLAALMSGRNDALGSMLQGGLLTGTGSGLLDSGTGGLGQVGQKIWDNVTDSEWWNDLFDFGD